MNKFQCEACGKEFKDEKALKVHVSRWCTATKAGKEAAAAVSEAPSTSDKGKTTGKANKGQEKAPKAPPAPKTMVACLCGCGVMVPKKFAQGHDMRLKSTIVQNVKGGHKWHTSLTKEQKAHAESHWMDYIDKALNKQAKDEALGKGKAAKAAKDKTKDKADKK